MVQANCQSVALYCFIKAVAVTGGTAQVTAKVSVDAAPQPVFSLYLACLGCRRMRLASILRPLDPMRRWRPPGGVAKPFRRGKHKPCCTTAVTARWLESPTGCQASVTQHTNGQLGPVDALSRCATTTMLTVCRARIGSVL